LNANHVSRKRQKRLTRIASMVRRWRCTSGYRYPTWASSTSFERPVVGCIEPVDRVRRARGDAAPTTLLLDEDRTGVRQ